MNVPARTAATALAGVVLLGSLVACASDSPDTDTTEAAAVTEGWPREIVHAAGTTEIPDEPVRIVSTSPKLAGSLLAIDAPLLATASAPVTGLTNDIGFFNQWADVAEERGVEVLYTDLELDFEAIEAFEPDLIVGAADGADTVLEAYDQLSEIAPTILYDHESTPWIDLTIELGEATGLEENAAAATEDFETWTAEQAALVTPPEGPTAVVVYIGTEGFAVYKPSSPQGELLEQMGIEVYEVPEEFSRPDIVQPDAIFVTAENMAASLEGVETVLIVPVFGPAENFTSDPLLANQAAVVGDGVYTINETIYSLDYFSATDTVDTVVTLFGN